MPANLDYLEGRRFCVVFVKVIDLATERVQLQCLRGRASIERGRLNVVNEVGGVFTVPSTAVASVMPSDGSALLKDAEYFCLVKADENIAFVPSEELD